jgi:hypothetical protein
MVKIQAIEVKQKEAFQEWEEDLSLTLLHTPYDHQWCALPFINLSYISASFFAFLNKPAFL